MTHACSSTAANPAAAARIPDEPPPLARGARATVEQALALFHAGRYRRCLTFLWNTEEKVGADPRVTALLNACGALLSGDYRAGVDSCTRILEGNPDHADLYCVAGVLLLRAGRRGPAYALFRRGLCADPGHAWLRTWTAEMGVRRPPVLPFLHRRHPANRWLGLARARLLSRSPSPGAVQ